MTLMENVFRRTLPIFLTLHAHGGLGGRCAAASLARATAGVGRRGRAPRRSSSTPAARPTSSSPTSVPCTFFGIAGHTLLMLGLVVCALGLLFGLVIYTQLKNMPVHESMREISELIYETCKTYLITQGKFILILEVFIGAVIALYFGVLQHFSARRRSSIILRLQPGRHRRQLRRGVVRHPRQHLRELAHGVRQRCAASRIPCYAIPLTAGMSIGMLLISRRAA